MIIAILSALHTFLKYDALEDRHQQYSRHFGNLQVDLETLLAKPVEQRGSAGTMVERYKIKYAVLINNAPDLPENLERRCCWQISWGGGWAVTIIIVTSRVKARIITNTIARPNRWDILAHILPHYHRHHHRLHHPQICLICLQMEVSAKL